MGGRTNYSKKKKKKKGLAGHLLEKVASNPLMLSKYLGNEYKKTSTDQRVVFDSILKKLKRYTDRSTKLFLPASNSTHAARVHSKKKEKQHSYLPL